MKLHRTKILFLVAGLLVVASATAFRQSRVSAAPVPTKIAIVNIQEAIVSTEDGKREVEALQKRFGPRQAALKQLNDEIAGIKKRLEVKTIAEADRKALLKDAEAKQKKLQRDYGDAQVEMQQAEQEVVGRIGNKMLTVLKSYSDKNEYAVVLDVSSPQTPVLYANPATNITKDLIAAYNASSAPAAPTPQATAPSATPATPQKTPPTPQK